MCIRILYSKLISNIITCGTNTLLGQAISRDRNWERKTEDALVDYTSSKTRSILGKVALASFAIIIVLVPVFLMFLTSVDRAVMASIVTGFVFVFMILMSTGGDVPAHELFLCIVGYCAILVAMLGSKMSQGGSCPSNL